MKKIFTKIILLSLLINCFLKHEQIKAMVPYYYLPTQKNLNREGLSIGKNAYQHLYFGQIENSLNLAKLAVKINRANEKLWLILSEAQIANKLYEEALISLNNAQKIDPTISEIYFAKSSIYMMQSKFTNAKHALIKGLKITPDNYRGIFQLGNIFLIEKNFDSAIKEFDKAVKIKPDFWQAINNKGLAYFEKDKIDLSIKLFEKAISIDENAEPILGLASCLRLKNIDLALALAKKALTKNPSYVDFDYRKEQLWGEKIQNSTEKLFKNNQLQKEIKFAKSKINKTS